MIYNYQFAFDNGEVLDFPVDTDRPSNLGDLPDWTRLDYHRCDNCPLAPGESTDRCPTAVDVHGIASSFRGRMSTGRTQVTVYSSARDYIADCDIQTGLRSLIGLVMALSACPHLSQLRGMARTHLPFATFDETLARTIGHYLTQQFLIAREGGIPDFELTGLRAQYERLESVNRHFSQRVRAASESDANLNAIVALFSITQRISLALDSSAAQLRKLLGEPQPSVV